MSEFKDAGIDFYRKLRGTTPLSEGDERSPAAEVSTKGNHAGFRMFQKIREKQEAAEIEGSAHISFGPILSNTPDPAPITEGFKCPLCESVLRKPTPGIDLSCKCGATFTSEQAQKIYEDSQ